MRINLHDGNTHRVHSEHNILGMANGCIQFIDDKGQHQVIPVSAIKYIERAVIASKVTLRETSIRPRPRIRTDAVGSAGGKVTISTDGGAIRDF